MAKSPYTGRDLDIEELHPVTLEEGDLERLANGAELEVPIAVNAAVVLEYDDG